MGKRKTNTCHRYKLVPCISFSRHIGRAVGLSSSCYEEKFFHERKADMFTSTFQGRLSLIIQRRWQRDTLDVSSMMCYPWYSTLQSAYLVRPTGGNERGSGLYAGFSVVTVSVVRVVCYLKIKSEIFTLKCKVILNKSCRSEVCTYSILNYVPCFNAILA